MQRIAAIQKKRERLAVGLISGTSMDGVDAALVRIRGCGEATEVEVLEFATVSYPEDVQSALRELSVPTCESLDALCRLNFLLGELFAEAALSVLKQARIRADAVDFIGSHGQTVRHLPGPTPFLGREIRATLQIGEPAVIAKRTGILTVADFRPADLALGGEGAPLVPLFDYLIFHSATQSRCLLNLGGIANVTVLPAKASRDEMLAFDVGPGNMLIDQLCRELFSAPFDRDGQIASRGVVCEALLEKNLTHPYFFRPPPKSTGREEFGEAFAADFLVDARRQKLESVDIVATATELTARAIAESLRRFVLPRTPVDELVVSGGGAHNAFLLRSLRKHLDGISVVLSDVYGISVDAKEAVCFAVLANETLMGHPNNVPEATGASAETVLGKICL